MESRFVDRAGVDHRCFRDLERLAARIVVIPAGRQIESAHSGVVHCVAIEHIPNGQCMVGAQLVIDSRRDAGSVQRRNEGIVIGT